MNLAAVLLFLTIRVGASVSSTDIFRHSTTYGNELAVTTLGVKNFTDSSSYRGNYCDRYRSMISNEKDIQHVLSGSEVSLLMFPGNYFLYDNTNGINSSYPGIHARILDYIAEQGNFTWRQSFGVYVGHDIGNMTLTDYLDWSVGTFDVVAGLATASTGRMNRGISFITAHYDGSLIMVRLKEELETTKFSWFNYLRPFSTAVWFVIFATVVFSGFTYQFVEYLGKGREEGVDFVTWFVDNLYLSLLNFTGNYLYEPTTLGTKVFGFFCAVWGMVITTTYTANLASILVATGSKGPAPKLNEFRDVVDKRIKICVYSASYAEEYLREYYAEVGKYLVPVGLDEMYSSLREGKCQVLVDYKQNFKSNINQIASNPNCDLEWQGREIKALSDGFATRLDPGLMCTDLVNEVFNFFMKDLEDKGMLDEFWEEHNNYWSNNNCIDETQRTTQNQSKRKLKGGGGKGGAAGGGAAASTAGGEGGESGAMNLKDMGGTMLWQLFGSVIAILVAMLSNSRRKMKINKEEKETTTKKLNRNDNDSDEETSVDTALSKQLVDLSSQLVALKKALTNIQESLDSKASDCHFEADEAEEVDAIDSKSTMTTDDSSTPSLARKPAVRQEVHYKQSQNHNYEYDQQIGDQIHEHEHYQECVNQTDFDGKTYY